MSQHELRGLWQKVEQARVTVEKHRDAVLGATSEIDPSSVASYQRALLAETVALQKYAEARKTLKVA